jgi:hypothetical protein
MARSVASYRDAVVIPLPEPDDVRLKKVHKKGFADFVKTLSVDEFEEWLKLYPSWYLKNLRQFLVLYNPREKKVRVVVPKRRAHRADYYAWLKYLPLPKGGYWYLLTLTLYRSVGLVNAWRSINRWISKFMNRFRSYLNTVYGKDLSYLWVVEAHEDGFPHVHVLIRMPYVSSKLNFARLLDFFHSWWVDDEGNPLCARHGVDLKCVRGGVDEVRRYLLKYLVKNHAKYWRVEVYPDGRVAYRRSSALMWLFRVRLFGMSQDIRGTLKEEEKNRVKGRSKWIWYGSTPASRVYRLFYKPLGIAWELWIYQLPDKCYMEFPDKYLPVLVPSAFSARGSPADDDDLYADLIANF